MEQGKVQVVAIDPGTTTGVIALEVDNRWLVTDLPVDWKTLGRACRIIAVGQIGRHGNWQQGLTNANTRPFENYNAAVHAKGTRIDVGEVRQVGEIVDLLARFPEAAIVIEDFQLRTRSMDREALSPDRLRLAIESVELLYGSGRVPYLQQPSLAKNTASDDRLKLAGLWAPGKPHANDALRHATTFLRRARADRRLLADAFGLVHVGGSGGKGRPRKDDDFHPANVRRHLSAVPDLLEQELEE